MAADRVFQDPVSEGCNTCLEKDKEIQRLQSKLEEGLSPKESCDLLIEELIPLDSNSNPERMYAESTVS
jgi:hypothetical protein